MSTARGKGRDNILKWAKQKNILWLFFNIILELICHSTSPQHCALWYVCLIVNSSGAFTTMFQEKGSSKASKYTSEQLGYLKLQTK